MPSDCLLRNAVSPRKALHCALAAWLLIGAVSANAQEFSYKQQEQKIRDQAGRQMARLVRTAWQDQTAFNQNQQKFDEYFTDYLFPAMTRTDPTSLAELGSRRTSFLRMTFWDTKNIDVHQHLTQLTFEQMKPIVVDRYHPAVRYNAMLIIGWLDERPGIDRGETPQPPVPLPAAADFMIEQIGSNAPEVVQLGALIGLRRHARYGLGDRATKVRDLLVPFITSERPKDVSPEGHAWLVMWAARVLAEMGEIGDQNEVHNALVAIIGNEEMPLQDRIYATESIVQLKDKYTADAGIDTQATVQSLGQLTQAALEYEIEEARTFNNQRAGGGFGAALLLPGNEEPPPYPRERLLQRFNSILDAVAAVDPALPDETKVRIKPVVDGLASIRDIAVDRDNVDLALTKELELNMKDLLALIKSLSGDNTPVEEVQDAAAEAFGA